MTTFPDFSDKAALGDDAKSALPAAVDIPLNQNTSVYAALDKETERVPANAPRYSDPSAADQFHSMLSDMVGIPVSWARTIGDIESQNKPQLAPNKFGYTGLYQQGRENVPHGWDGDLRDPIFNTRVTARTLQSNMNFFRKKLGREPDLADIYMMHNQGIVGGPALIKAAELEPDLPAYKALAKYASQLSGHRMSEQAAFAHIRENMWGDLAHYDPRRVTSAQWVQAVRQGIGRRLSYYEQYMPGGQRPVAEIPQAPRPPQPKHVHRQQPVKPQVPQPTGRDRLVGSF